MHRSQIFLILLLTFVAGVVAGSFFDVSSWLISAIIVAALIGAVVFFRRGSKHFNAKAAMMSFSALFFVLGVLRFESADLGRHALEEFAQAAADLKTSSRKLTITVNGYVDGEPEAKADRQRFVLRVKEIETDSQLIKTDERVQITTRLAPGFRFGDTLKITGEPFLPNSPADSDFDYRAYLAKDRIYTLMSFPEIEAADLKLSRSEEVRRKSLAYVFKFKNIFESSISRSIAEPEAAFIEGILLGARSQIPQSIKDNFARTSTSHILAISGYNITTIALVFSAVFLYFLKRQTAFWFSLAGIILFTLLTGAQASVIRAAVMGILLLIARREGRLYSARNSVVFAGAVMIFLNPQILRFDVGFQLSFLATLGLIYLSPFFERYLDSPNQPVLEKSGLREILVMTISAQIFVLPLLVYYFHNLSLVSLPVNILILPLVPYAMLFGFLSGTGGLIWSVLGQWLGYFAWLLAKIILLIVGFFGGQSWAAVSFNISWPVAVILYLFLVMFLVKKYAAIGAENK